MSWRLAYRFTLRTLLGVMLAFALVCGSIGRMLNETRRQQQIGDELHERGCHVEWNALYLPSWLQPLARSELRGWISRPEALDVGGPLSMGGHSFTRAESSLIDDPTDIEKLVGLRHLRLIQAAPALVARLRLARFPDLESLQLSSRLWEDDARTIQPRLEHPPRLSIDLSAIPMLRNLRKLAIECYTLDESQIAAVGRAASLEQLTLTDCRLPDGWIESLPLLPKLETLGRGAHEAHEARR